MDALITYSQTHQQLMSSMQSPNKSSEIPNSIANPATVSPINNMIQNPMYYHQAPNVDSYNQLLMNQYNIQQHQQQNSKVNDFFKLFSNAAPTQSNPVTPPACSIPPNSQTNFPGNFLQNSQQGLLNQAGFNPSQLNGINPGSFMPNDEASLYNPGFNSSLVGRLASGLLSFIVKIFTWDLNLEFFRLHI